MMELNQIFTTAFANLLSGLVTNMVYIALFVWGIKRIVKEVPHWLDRWENIKTKQRVIDRALDYGK